MAMWLTESEPHAKTHQCAGERKREKSSTRYHSGRWLEKGFDGYTFSWLVPGPDGICKYIL